MKKIVQFSDGTYGVRRGWLFFEFLDLSCGCWMERGANFFQHCKGSQEAAKQALDQILDNGVPL